MIDPNEQTASTAPVETEPRTDEGSGTGLPSNVERLVISRPSLFMAQLVLGAALVTGGAQGTLHTPQDWFRRREDLAAESSTEAVPADAALVQHVKELFEQGASEFFHDGVESRFSRTLLKTIARHGQAAFRAIAEYLFSGIAKPDVASETLRWIADYNDASTLAQRWSILQRTLADPSPVVRDGAILGFAALNDPRARPLLIEARNLEHIAELRALIDQVIAQLEHTR